MDFLYQGWNSDEDDGSYLDPTMRKRAVKVKHVKRREKRSEKKVISSYGYEFRSRKKPRRRLPSDKMLNLKPLLPRRELKLVKKKKEIS